VRSSSGFERKCVAPWVRLVRALGEGLPQYVDVPGKINVLEILRLWTYAKSSTWLNGARCVTTSWGKDNIGFRGKCGASGRPEIRWLIQ